MYRSPADTQHSVSFREHAAAGAQADKVTPGPHSVLQAEIH